jgi:hypothetical protein
MTLPVNPNRVAYTANGTLTAFAFPYRFFDDSDIKAVIRSAAGVESTKSLNSDYSVTGEDEDAGGTVTFIAAPDASSTVILYRAPDLEQELDLADLNLFPAEEVEREFDRQVAMVQRLDERLNRAVVLNDADESLSMTLPLKADRTGQFAYFDASGRMIAAQPFDYTGAISAFGQLLLDDASASEALSTLGVSTYVKTLVDDTDASQFLGTLGVSTFIKTLVDDTDASQALGTLGVSAFIRSLVDDASASAARVTLGLDFSQTIAAFALAGTGANSVGSSSNKILRFADATQVGVDWTLATDSTLGTVMTNLLPGLFAFQISAHDTTAVRHFGFSLDATGTDLTAHFYNLGNTKRLAHTVSDINQKTNTMAVQKITAGQVIRAHVDATLDQTDVTLKITRIGH